jgi:hypothetical protein
MTNQGSEQLSIDPRFADRGMTCLQMILRCWLSNRIERLKMGLMVQL